MATPTQYPPGDFLKVAQLQRHLDAFTSLFAQRLDFL